MLLAHGSAAIEGALRPFAEGVASSVGATSYASENRLEDGEYVTEQEHNQLKDKSDRWLRNNELERTPDGWIRKIPESGLHKSGELAGAAYALVGGGSKAGKGAGGVTELARKFHQGEIREFGRFKDEFMKLVTREKDEVGKVSGKPAITTFKGPARRFTPDEIKMAGATLGKSPFKSVNALSGVGKKLGNKASEAAKEIGKRIGNYATTETKAAAVGGAYKLGGAAATLATEFYVAAEIAENVLNEYAPEGLTAAEKQRVGQWYGANYIFTSTFSKMWKRVGVSNTLANLLLAEATSLSLVLAGLDPKDRQAVQQATTEWLRSTVEGLVESDKLTKEDVEWG